MQECYIEISAHIEHALADDNVAQQRIELHRFEQNIGAARQMPPVFLQ